MHAGRNDPCPCGSGKKYKHCHGGSNVVELPVGPEATWRRLRSLLRAQPTTMMRFVDQYYGHDAMDEAWDEFTLWDSDEPAEFDSGTPHLELFMAWFHHHWEPGGPETSVEDRSLHDRSPTRALIERRGDRLDPLLRRYLEVCVETPFSVYELLRCEPGRGFRVRDALTGAELEVLERSASSTLRVGDTIYGLLITIDGVTLIDGLGSIALPLAGKLAVIDLRERIAPGRPFSTEMVREWEMELRGEYLEAADHSLNPPPPRLQNTDGEEIVFHHLVFEIDSGAAALAALADLAHGSTRDELLESAEWDPDGELLRVQLEWSIGGNAKHSHWESTVLAHIEIEARELRADVISAERAARVRAILEERLGPAIRHRGTLVRSVADAVAEGPGRTVNRPPKPSLDDEPEVRARLKEMVEAHYEGWIAQPVPALGGITPMEAVGTRVGREKVDALITDMELRAAERDLEGGLAVFARLRERLGLVKEGEGSG